MELLGFRAASSFLGVPEATLRYWRGADLGPASFKVGRRVVYRRQELERWIAEREAASVRGGRAAV
ncbi:helix-turn-helix domain-containing protein [Mycolicibacterium fortuitum]|nr:helix-turn-helix domain-containing protein [Mycolicibacterium fortuitum]MDG5772360.1 helix-turn-helix domain-containing protein [Mycolicibacterium fortuitum]MDG5782623.1 helix-turn-helix domain-containing protein [Mycolicibacterium fortuitum]